MTNEYDIIMEILNYIRMTSAGLSMPAIVGLGFLLWRAGFFVKGNGNGSYQPQIDELKRDMHDIKEDISDIKEGMGYVRGKLGV